jgi:hypothetical protein
VSSLLLLKLLLVPSLVAAVTLAARRWGPAVGGWLAGLPIVGGPVLAFYTVEQGTAFAAAAAQGTMAGLAAIAVFAVVYAHMCLRAKWYVATITGWCAFAVMTYVLYLLRPGLTLSVVAPIAAVLGATRLMPRVARVTAGGGASTPGDLAIRMVATATLVVVLTSLADRLGPALSGLLNAFPIATTTIAAFTQAQRGPAAAVAFFRGFLPALVGFTLFCLVLTLTLGALGLSLAMTIALLAQLAVHTVILGRLRASAVWHDHLATRHVKDLRR